MSAISKNSKHQTQANALILACALLVAIFWSIEFYWSLKAHDQRAEELVVEHQQRALEQKAEQLRDMFNELYNTSRTISLLPMIRAATGENRRDPQEDAVAQGRLSVDTHRSLQQIYLNLYNHIQVSEIYYVLDGFDPKRGDHPFLVYDELIAAPKPRTEPVEASSTSHPPEIEEFEYEQFPQQLAWFRQHAPRFEYAEHLDSIPVRLSPWLLTCDNRQYVAPGEGRQINAEGMIYSMPVYGLPNGELHGMITTILRRNTLEARLLGVPFLPVTPEDQQKMRDGGWQMPEIGATFLLRNQEYGLAIYDRRHPLFANGVDAALATQSGSWQSLAIKFHTGADWELAHFLSSREVEHLMAPVAAAKQATIIGRLALLALLVALLSWGGWLLHRSRRELLRMAHFDSLTELPNRRSFFERLETTVARAKRNRSKIGLFFVDIAGFNAINDAHGHHAGDLLLAAVAERLVDSVRASDVVARKPSLRPAIDSVSRLGGDEFTIICDDMKNSDDLLTVAERILEAIRKPIRIGNDEVEISLYLGISCFPEDATDGEKLLMAAESAVQECRAQGPGFRLYNEEMRRRAERQHLLMLELQAALDKQQFVLFYQPKAQLATDCVVSLEALLRWRHPDLGLISPIEFIPLLERSGRIVEVGEWVLRQSCKDLMLLAGIGLGDMRISANVSVRQLKRGNFHETVQRVLEDIPIDPDRLILEITESMVMENLDEGREALEKLASLGSRLAIDDFGTGYSSLTYLQFLPLDYLKLDKSFIDGMTNDRARHIVQTVIQLARGLNLQTIAEGIETVEQKAELKALGCDMIQGYLLSKPRPLDEIIDWLRQRPTP